MDPLRWWKRRTFRKLKQKGKIKPEQFDREKLEQLGVQLIEFYEMMTKTRRLHLMEMEKSALSEIFGLMDTIDLILSEETDYGYLDKYCEGLGVEN